MESSGTRTCSIAFCFLSVWKQRVIALICCVRVSIQPFTTSGKTWAFRKWIYHLKDHWMSLTLNLSIVNFLHFQKYFIEFLTSNMSVPYVLSFNFEVKNCYKTLKTQTLPCLCHAWHSELISSAIKNFKTKMPSLTATCISNLNMRWLSACIFFLHDCFYPIENRSKVRSTLDLSKSS